MLAGQVAVDPGITQRLGEEGVQRVLSSLWPVDCQMCGKPLQGTRPALTIEDGDTVLTAWLNHPDCRASQWNDSGPIRFSNAALLSYRCTTIVLPITIGTEREQSTIPIVVVNPGMEMVFLEKDTAGQWAIATEAPYAQAGLHRPPFDFDTPVPGVTARLHGQDVTVSVSAPPFPAFTSGAENNIGADIRRQRGLLLLVTHAIDPSEIRRPSQMRGVLTGDRTVGGWVRLE